MKTGDKVVIISGRLKGETGIVVGTSDLNMEHTIIVRRANQRARNSNMGFSKEKLALESKGVELNGEVIA